MSVQHPLIQHLKTFYGLDNFRSNQQKIIEEIMDNNAVAAFLSTGTGKTLLYQFPTTFLKTKTVVISPLISLINDQFSRSMQLKIPSFKIHSQQSVEENNQCVQSFLSCDFGILFLSPERWNSSVKNIFQAEKLQLMIVLDEAHCISTWGKSFRKDYLEISYPIEETGSKLIALSATPTADLVDLIKSQFHLKQLSCYTSDLFRLNLKYDISVVPNKIEFLTHLLKKDHTASILYIQNRRLIHQFQQYFTEQSINCTIYHAGLTLDEKQKNHQAFFEDRVSLMIATSAYGMGIDKPNIRNVYHLELPFRAEDYIQETGRAGRDGKPSHCRLILEASELNRYPQTEKYLDSLLDILENKSPVQNYPITIDRPKDTLKRNLLTKIFSETGIHSEKPNQTENTVYIKYANEHILESYLSADVIDVLDVILHVYSGKIYYEFISVDLNKIADILHQSSADIYSKLMIAVDSFIIEKRNDHAVQVSTEYEIYTENDCVKLKNVIRIYQRNLHLQSEYIRKKSCLNKLLFKQLMPDLSDHYSCGNCAVCIESNKKKSHQHSTDYLIQLIRSNKGQILYSEIIRRFSDEWNFPGDDVRPKSEIDADINLLLGEGILTQEMNKGKVILVL